MKISKTRRILLSSFIAILFSLLTFTFTTFAWFSDRVSSSDNIITVGNLDAEMYWTDNLNSGKWYNIENSEHNTVFSHDNYEPGYSEVRYIKIVNAGSLAFEYDLSLLPVGEIGKLAEVVDVYYLSNVSNNISSNELSSMNKQGTIKNTLGKSLSGVQCLLPEGSNDLIYHEHEIVVAIGLKMQTTAGNEYQGQSIGDGFSIKLVATQFDYEKDSFGSDYDTDATFPASLSVGISTTNNKVNKAASIRSDLVEVFIPEGVEVNAGISALTLTVNEMDETGSNITLEGDEVATSLDVHIDGVSENNTVPMIISISNVASKYLNKGNIELYHVEDGQTIQMTEVNSKNDLTKHNQFYYDSASGTFMVALASFSEVVAVEKTINAWGGAYNTEWYDSSKNEFVIYNGDQLAGLSAIVGGMVKDENGNVIESNFAKKTIKLIADINLGYDPKEANNPIFYPIGYYNNTGSYTKVSDAGVVSGRKPFEGTFDGNGHTISNFYQNTWEMFGDYNSGYSGNPNHYKDGMGLFAFVRNGVVTNLHIDNFSCDSEFGISGVVAAYANNTIFKNIAITNCTPGVYNNANGGIVGYVGSYYSNSYEETGKEYNDEGDVILFSNITVDNTNTIRALWGTWDGCCAGILGRYDSKSKIIMDHCYVAAKMDVFNDVCGNYQYYWYRYSAMLVGSIEVMTTDKNEYIVPDISKFTVSNVYVHFDTWNDYYYCELVANSQASYTHDYQFSRLTVIDNISAISNDGGKTFKKTGDYIILDVFEDNSLNKSGTCYHIREDENGDLYRHIHTETEEVNGETILKEDKQGIYLPFNQIYQGWGWGVKNIPFTEAPGVTKLDDLAINSIDKFTVNTETDTDEFSAGDTITLGKLFDEVSNPAIEIFPSNIQVGITYVDELNQTRKVDAKFTRNTTKWQDGTITLPEGEYDKVYVTIQDYICCKPLTIELNVKQPEKFESKFTNESFIYRVGNGNEISLGSLFKEKGTVSVIDEKVIVKVNGKEVTLSDDKYWEDKKLQIKETGVVSVTISDGYSLECKIEKLEVVDAMNATSATSAKTYNVVLLNDCGFSSLEVSGGYTLYGNGFTMTCGSDSAALDLGYSFVTLNNGTLDNVQIVTPNFDYAVLYKSNLEDSGNRSQTTDKTRYYNAKSGVMTIGDSQILNSRISGARAAVNVSGGNLLIDNSRIEGGAIANILVGAANSLELKDVTLIQKPIESTYKDEETKEGKTLMGFSVLYLCDSEGKATPTTLSGTLVQYAWVNEEYKQYVPSNAQDIVASVFEKTEYIHNIEGKDCVNLGFAYMPEDTQKTVDAPDNIIDNRTNNERVPYVMTDVKIKISILSTTVYVYSYTNTNGTNEAFTTEATYAPNKYSDIITVSYSDTVDGLTIGKSLGANGWVYELNVDLDKLSGYKLDFSKLSMSVNGVTVNDYKVNGNAKPTSPEAVTAGGTIYTLTATVKGKEYTATYKVTGTETSEESPSLVAANYEAGLCVASSYGGTWHGAAPALEGIQIKYWSVAEQQYKTINLSDYTPTTKGQFNGTNTTWTYSPANGDFTLTLTGGQVHSSNNVYAMPVVCERKLYFVAAKSSGLVNSGNSARTIPVSYTFKDNNNGEVLTFSHTWSVAENKNAQYKYSDFCNGTLTQLKTNDTCLAEGTLITMNDGTKRAVEDLRKGDLVMAFDHLTGEVTFNKVIIVVKTQSDYYKNTFVFDDGTELVTINEHGIYDLDLNKYVNIDHLNYLDYLGHRFVSIDVNGNISSKVLVDVKSIYESGYKYDIVTNETLNYVAEDTLSVTHVLVDVINTFEFDQNMKYDQEKMMEDINKYGLYEYDEWSEYCDIKVFEEYNIPVMKVGISKGLYTKEYIISLINTFVLDDSVQIISE